MTHVPLDGLLVVAIEQAVAAPLCTARLADAGARVIKIERPDGDFARGYDRAAGGDSSYFSWANHGKESVVLDFKTTEDAALLNRIIDRADIFVQNLAPGALDRSGFGSDQLRHRNPRLITVDVSGYGEAPELAAKKAYDLLIQAESGLIGISGGPGELGRIGVSICDVGTGITAYGAVLEALIQRGITGNGSAVKVSLFDVAAEWMTVPLVQHEYGDGGPQRVGLKHPTIAPYGAFATSDGSLTLISVQNEREWHRLAVDVLAAPQLATDPQFASNDLRVSNRDQLERQLSALVGGLTRHQFQHRLAAASIAFGTVSALDDLAQHPALRRRTVTSSVGQQISLPAHPVRADTKPVRPQARSVPKLGAHTKQVRAEFAPDTPEHGG